MIGQIVSHYRILEQLGEGGMGVVYLAEDMHLGRQVAIKFLSKTTDEHHYRARFLREARSISALSHHNIATIFEYGEVDGGQPFIVMELIKGETLNDLLFNGELTLKRAVEIVESVADALSEAHERGIVHRDVKPSNVIVNERGVVKVLDFGLAKHFGDDANGSHAADPDANTLLATRTRSGVVVGTPLYLSPEQATGASVDQRSDIFALGALLYECIAGRPAFSGGSVLEIGAQVIHVTPQPPSTFNPRVPAELDRIALKALQKRPEARYQTVGEMAKQLRAVREKLKDDALPTPRLTAMHPTLRSSAFRTISETIRRPRLSIFSLVLVLGVLGAMIAAVVYFSRPRLHEPTVEALRAYERGTEALRDGAFYQASKYLESATAADPQFALAHARLAEAWMELDYSDKAMYELLTVKQRLVPDSSVLPRMDALYLDAVAATVTRDFPSAIKNYTEIAEHAEGPEKARAFVDLGRAYQNNEEIDKAINAYQRATEIDLNYPTSFLRIGTLYRRKREVTSANSSLERAETLYQQFGNVEGRTEAVYQRGLLLRDIGKLGEAREQLLRALDMARTTGNESQQIAALLDLSYLSFLEGQTTSSQQYASEATALAQQRGLENLAASSLINLGRTYQARGEYGQAENYIKQALDFARRNKARLREAMSLMNLGGLYIQQFRTDEGLPLVEQALTFFEQGNYRSYSSICLISIGRANRQKGNYEAARQAFQKKLQFDEQAGDQYEMAFSYGEIGSVLTEEEKFLEALAYYDKSFTINRSQGNRLLMAYNNYQRGKLLWPLGRYPEARDELAKAYSIASEPAIRDKSLIAGTHLSYAEMALSERRFPEAIAKAKLALEAAGTQYPGVAVAAKYTLGLAQVFSGAKEAGKSSCEESVAMAQSAGDAALLSRAMLALAEARLENGDAEGALENALRAEERFTRAGQQESQWRAWLVAARASQRKGDETSAQQQMSKAAEVLAKLRQNWGPEAFQHYASRPDVQSYMKQLGGAFTADAQTN